MELLSVAKLYSNPMFLSQIFLFFSILIWLKLAKRKTLNLPPSPPKLPIIGNIHQVGKLPHQSFRDLSRKYGPLLLLHMGSNPTLLVSSADLVKEIAKNNDVLMSDRPTTTAADIVFYGCKDLAFAPYGEYWRQVRKMTVVELFSHQRVHSFQFVREEEVEVVINKIRSACLKGELVNLSEMLNCISSNIISRCILSHESEGEDGCSNFAQLIKKEMVVFPGFCFGDMFHYLRWLDVLTGYIQSMKKLSAKLDAFLDQVIQERGALGNREQVSTKKDFLAIILQLQKDGILEMDLTQDNIKAILLDMFVAGTDTTATTIEWMMAELLKHPNAMKKVQQEIRNVVGKKSKVDIEDIGKMKYLKCAMKETLRLHTPLALIGRKTSVQVKLGGYDIPKDTPVMVNALDIHTDPKRWEKAEEFTPERFENSSIDFQGQDFHYIPFGFGRRACPGLSFGVVSIEYVIANLLYWFDWKLPAGETAENIDMTERYDLTIAKKTPLNVLPMTPSHSM